MPTVITHGIVGAAGFTANMPVKNKIAFAILSVAAPVIPDLDVISFALGVKYGDFFGHRGFSHSILFAAIIALIFSVIAIKLLKMKEKSNLKAFFYFFALAISHGVLDALTSGGLGVAFFSPFDNTRYFFPVTPIKVAPISVIRFFSLNGLQVMLSEILWVWLPLFVLTGLYLWYKKYFKAKGKGQKS